MDRPRFISAGSIVIRDGKILMVRHKLAGRWDFFVLPGGRARENENAIQACVRETKEEAGVACEVVRLAYVEDMQSPEMRECKLWFFCRDLGGTPNAEAFEAAREHIVSAAFISRGEFEGKTVYPPFLLEDEFWTRLDRGFPDVEYLGLREREH